MIQSEEVRQHLRNESPLEILGPAPQRVFCAALSFATPVVAVGRAGHANHTLRPHASKRAAVLATTPSVRVARLLDALLGRFSRRVGHHFFRRVSSRWVAPAANSASACERRLGRFLPAPNVTSH